MTTNINAGNPLPKKLSPFSLLNPSKLKVLLSLGFKGYLADKGWFKAFQTKSSIDENGQAIPWVTYSFIDFIRERLHKTHDIFEYGSGNSTVFYAKNSGSVYAVEHDEQWYQKNAAHNLPNVEMVYRGLDAEGAYVKAALEAGTKFHIIIVDGRKRVDCCKESIHALTEDGVIVLDDSERPKYAEAVSFLLAQGFKHIPFSGIAPGVIISKVTSVFYRDKNCLGI